jgi:hypothetical protein
MLYPAKGASYAHKLSIATGEADTSLFIYSGQSEAAGPFNELGVFQIPWEVTLDTFEGQVVQLVDWTAVCALQGTGDAWAPLKEGAGVSTWRLAEDSTLALKPTNELTLTSSVTLELGVVLYEPTVTAADVDFQGVLLAVGYFAAAKIHFGYRDVKPTGPLDIGDVVREG